MSYLGPLYVNMFRTALFLILILLSRGWGGMSKECTKFNFSEFFWEASIYAQETSLTGIGQRPEIQSLREDATLNDICLLDAQNGWAVGDSGVIWHTANGGELWEPQESGTIGQLTSVSFVDALHGWIGGRVSSPGSDEAIGILLSTEDGGRTWTPTSRATPPMDQLHFANSRVGFAVGETSVFYSTGVISTDSGGRGWTLFGEPGSRYGWICGDFCEIPTENGSEWVGTLCGPDGVTAVTSRSLYTETTETDLITTNVMAGTTPPRTDTTDTTTDITMDAVGSDATRRVVQLSAAKKSGWNACCAERGMPRAVCFDAAYRRGRGGSRGMSSLPMAWAVGDGGLVLRSDSLGTRWTRPDLLPEGVERFDFRTVAVDGNHLWIAGAPGHCVWKSDDGGQSWRVVRVPSKLPIRKLVFADAQHGIAVGSLGLILVTDDGGESWTISRGAERRVAVLAVANSTQNIPWEPLIEASGRGYRTVLILSGDMETDDANKFFSTATTRLTAFRARRRAAEMAATFGIAFDDSTAVTTTDETWFSAANASADASNAAFRTWLATRIRCYDPSVLLVEREMDQGFSSGILRRLVLEAATAAESLDRFQTLPLESNVILGSESKPNTPLESLENAALELPASRAISRIYEVFRDANFVETEAQGDRLVDTARLASRLGRRVVDAAATARATTQMCYAKDFTTHIVCTPLVDSVPSRSVRNGYLTGIEESVNSQARSRWAGGRTDDPQEAICRLRYQQAEQMLQKLPNEPIVSWERLIQQDLPTLPGSIGAEGTAAVALAAAQQAFRSGMNGAGIRILEWYLETIPDGPATRAAQSLLLPRLYGREVVDRNETDAKSRQFKAERWYGTLQTFASGFYSPNWSLFQASIERRQGTQSVVAKRLAEIAPPWLEDVWTKLAKLENWVAVPRGNLPRGVYLCEKVSAKPYLDGKLEEAFWNRTSESTASESGRGVKAIRLQRSVDDPYFATVRFAHDDDYLYVAIEMVEFPGQNYAQGVGKRTRDATLESRDRVEICLDIDRDGMTWYRLAMDGRGWTQEDASGDRHWNPQWFVATSVTSSDGTPQTETGAAVDAAAQDTMADTIAVGGRGSTSDSSKRGNDPSSGGQLPRIRSMEVAIPLAEMGVVLSNAASTGETAGEASDAAKRVAEAVRGDAAVETTPDLSQSWNFVVRRRVPGVGTVVSQPEIQTMVFR